MPLTQHGNMDTLQQDINAGGLATGNITIPTPKPLQPVVPSSVPTQPTQTNQPLDPAFDPTIVAMTKAIRQQETGNRNIKGGSGESGRYQWMPGTWAAAAKQYLGNANADQTLENENFVAYNKVKDLKAKGYNPAQIAVVWNAGEGALVNDKWKTLVGPNSLGVHMDTPSYVNNVYRLYNQFKGQKAQDTTTPPPPPSETALQKQFRTEDAAGKSADIINSIGSALMPEAGTMPILPAIPGTAVGYAAGGILGEVEGVLSGAVAAVGTPIVNMFKGQDLTKDWWKNVINQGTEGAKFGFDIGYKGGQAATIGAATIALGGAGLAGATAAGLADVAFGYGQEYAGIRDLARSEKPEDKFQAGANMVMGGLAFLGVGKEILGKEFSKTSPTIKGVEPDGGTPPGGPDGGPPGADPSAFQKLIKDQVAKHNTRLLRETGLQATREERFGKMNTADYVTSQGHILRVTKNAAGKFVLDATPVIDSENAKMQLENVGMKKILETRPEHIDLERWRKDWLKQVSTEKDKSLGGSMKQKQDYVNAEVDATIENYKDKIFTGANGEKYLQVGKFNEVKQGRWAKAGFDKQTKEQVIKDADFQGGQAAKTLIENTVDDVKIKEINEKIGQRAQAIQMLQSKMDKGTTIPTSRTTRLIAAIAGSLEGSTIPGKVLGAMTGDKLVELMQNPNITAGALDFILKKVAARPDGGQILQYIDSYLQQQSEDMSQRLSLPEPSKFNMTDQRKIAPTTLGQKVAEPEIRPGQKALPPPDANKTMPITVFPKESASKVSVGRNTPGEKVIPSTKPSTAVEGEVVTHTPVEFKRAAAETLSKHPFALTEYTPAEYAKMDTHLSADKKTGYAIKDGDELVSVFNNGDKGAGSKAVQDAIENGAKRLDAFGYTPLTDFYKQFGFKETQRLPWDDQYMPKGWDLTKQGKPDIVYMELDPKKYDKYKQTNPSTRGSWSGSVLKGSTERDGRGVREIDQTTKKGVSKAEITKRIKAKKAKS